MARTSEDYTQQAINLFFTEHHLRIPFRLLQCKFLSTTEVLYLCYIFKRWSSFFDKEKLDGLYFYQTQTDIERETGMKRDKQQLCLSRLIEKGILDVQKRGMPARNFFRVNCTKLLDLINEEGDVQSTGKPSTSEGEQPPPVDGNSLIYYNNMNNQKEGITGFPSENPEVDESTVEASEGPVLRTRKKSSRLKAAPAASYGPPPKPAKVTYAPPSIERLILFWKDLGLKVPSNTTKSYGDIVAYLKQIKTGNGKLFGRKFTDDEVRAAMLNFSRAALDANYYPPPGVKKERLKALPLNGFLYNPFLGGTGSKSFFLDYVKEPPRILDPRTVALAEDKYPEATRVFIDWYKARKHGRVETVISTADHNKFIEASVRLAGFYTKYKDHIAMGVDSGLRGLAKLLCAALEKAVDGQYGNLSPGWFCSDRTFNDRLPAYLEEQAYWAEEYKMSPFDQRYMEVHGDGR